jgi:PAS domain S-box-containing protein
LNIRKKAITIVGTIVMVLVAVLTSISYVVVTGRFSRIENKEIKDHVFSVRNEFSNTLTTLEGLAGEWALLDDTYQFIKDRNQGFVNIHLVDSTFLNLRLNFMLFFDRKNELVYNRFFELQESRFWVDKDAVLEAVRKQSTPSLVSHPYERSRVSGILFVGSIPYLVSSHPIVQSDFKGPIRGTLIIGRILDADEAKRISVLTKTNVTFHRPDSTILKLPAETILSALDMSGGVYIAPVSSDLIAGYNLIPDISGTSVLLLEVTHHREFFQYGLTTWRQNAVAMLLFGVCFIILLICVLNSAILNRLRDLASNVNEVAGAAHSKKRLDVHASDEVGQLASCINTMLDALERYHALQLESEKQYRAIVEDQTDLICRTDPSGRLTFVNGAFCRFFNRDTETLIGRPFLEILPNFPKNLCSGKKAESQSHSCDVIQHETGLDHQETRWLQWHVRNLSSSPDSGGRQFVGQDISEQVIVRNALEENEHYLRQLLDSISPGIMVVNLENRQVVDVNASAEKLIQRKREDIIGKRCHRFVCPNDYNNCPVLDRNQRIDFSQRTLLRADGTLVPIIKTVVITERLGRRYLIESFMDISNLKKAEEDLRKSEERYRRFFEEDITGDALISADGIIIKCNDAFARIFGYDIAEEITSLDVALFYPDQIEREKFNDRLQQEKKLQRIEIEFTHRNGHPIHCIGNFIGSFGEDGKVTEITAYLFDDTKRVKLERDLRQAHKLEAIGTLAGGIAHDFNNILAGIMGYTEIALSEMPDEGSPKERLKKVLVATHRAKELVQQILTFSRQSESDPRPIELTPIIKEALKLMRASLPTTIDIRQDDLQQATVVADPVQIHQVIMNLCTNAGHAMKKKGGTLTISVAVEELGMAFTERHPDMTPGVFVRISVEDTGEGIPLKVMDRIFDPFFTTKNKNEGTGLGLSVVHGIVRKLGGAISVTSNKSGSRVDVFLPRAEEKCELPQEQSKTIPLGKEHIVFIDDEEFQVDIGTQMLKSLGYRVIGFTDSLQALKYITENADRVDIVITDMTMPHLTGVALARKMMETLPRLPIVLCSGFSDEISPEKALSMGISGYVAKPVLLTDLARKVREILDSRTSRNDS